MLAASLPDLDGISIVFGEDAYQKYHHTLTHNLPFAITLGALLATFASRKAHGTLGHRLFLFVLFVLLVHVHLLMDYFGSGPLWPIYYYWPVERTFRFINKTGWPLSSWQNILVAAGLLVWTLIIAIRQHRTPIELIAPRLGAAWIAWLQRRVR